MMKDFTELLSFVSGTDGLRKRKDIQLTPTQQLGSALFDTPVNDVASSAATLMDTGLTTAGPEIPNHVNFRDTRKKPQGAGIRSLAGASLTGLSKSIADSTSQPMLPVQMYGKSAIAEQLAGMRGLRYGGEVEDGETVEVGEDGKELVTKRPDGSVIVTPNPVTPNHGTPFGLEQTEISDSVPVTAPVVMGSEVRPDASQLLAQNQGLDERAILQQQIRDVLNQKTGKWGTARDIGVGALQGLNNAVNHRNDPIVPYSDVIKQRKLSGLVPQLEMLDAEDQRVQKSQQMTADANYRNALAVKAQAEAKRQEADIVHQQTADAVAGKKWTKLISGNKIYMQFPDGHTEAWIDPVTGKHGVDKTLVTARIPGTNETVEVEPGQKLTNATNLAVGDMTRTQQTNQFNANNEIEVQKTNIANQMKYGDDVRAVLTKAAEANAQIIAANPGLAASNGNVQAAANQLAILSEAYNASTDEDEKKEILKQFNSAQDALGKAQTEFYKHLGSVQGGQELVTQLKSAMPKKPGMIKYKPIAPVTSNSIGTYSKQDFIQRAKSHGLSGQALQNAVNDATQKGIIR